MTTITTHLPATVAVPRAAPVAAALFAALLQALERAHTAWVARAECTRQSDRVTEASAVRRYADRVRAADWRFAADLMAAADRHERDDI